jgi:sigma-B regulation protein RsbU (phosphoserine phosphatase)
MAVSAPSRVLLCAGDAPAAEEIGRALEQAGHFVRRHSIDRGEPADLPAHDVVVLAPGPGQGRVPEYCRRLRAGLNDAFLPVLLVADGDPAVRSAGLREGADACLTSRAPAEELAAQVEALLRLKAAHDRLTERAAEAQRANQRLQQTYQELDQELELARRIQRSMLPAVLPELPPVRFAVHYRPCGRVGGDFYDVFRLDENHVGFYVADVMGHGVPAGLLTIFLKKAVRAKEIFGREYRLLPPDEVLQHLNRDLLEQALADCPFITMVYGLLDRRDGTFAFARAGHPHPVYLPRSGPPELWQVHGTLLGVFETQFTTQTCRLRPGDKLLLYTDGLDAVTRDGGPSATERLLESAARHRALPVESFLAQLVRDFHECPVLTDDVTLLAVEVSG